MAKSYLGKTISFYYPRWKIHEYLGMIQEGNKPAPIPHTLTLSEALKEERNRDHGSTPDQIWDDLWSVMKIKHPELSDEEITNWVNRKTAFLY